MIELERLFHVLIAHNVLSTLCRVYGATVNEEDLASVSGRLIVVEAQYTSRNTRTEEETAYKGNNRLNLIGLYQLFADFSFFAAMEQ